MRSPAATLASLALAEDYDLVIGRAVGDPARAAMLLRLMDGCGHSARDLATAAGVSASAASAHLRHLIKADTDLRQIVVGAPSTRKFAPGREWSGRL